MPAPINNSSVFSVSALAKLLIVASESSERLTAHLVILNIKSLVFLIGFKYLNLY